MVNLKVLTTLRKSFVAKIPISLIYEHAETRFESHDLGHLEEVNFGNAL